MNKPETESPGLPKLLRRQDLQHLLQVSSGTIERMIDRGVLPAPIFFSKRMRRWRPEDIVSFLERRDGVNI